MNRLSQFSALCATLMIVSGCSTVTDMVTSNIPEGHSGRPSIVVSLRAQEAYLYRAGQELRRRAYPVDAKDIALRLVAFKSSVRTKIIAPAFMVTTLMTRATS